MKNFTTKAEYGETHWATQTMTGLRVAYQKFLREHPDVAVKLSIDPEAVEAAKALPRLKKEKKPPREKKRGPKRTPEEEAVYRKQYRLWYYHNIQKKRGRKR